jgi:hypothetical protein
MGGLVAVIDIGFNAQEQSAFAAETGLEFFECDLASQQSIESFVAIFSAKV